ncbi:type II toxin-antitoxin system VapC family toxin [Roseibium marinum]|nr:PIN domain-containing protein [Roseibium marinum]
MEPIKRLYLDTNMFILLGEGHGDARRSHLIDIVSAAPARDSAFLCTSEFTLAELLVVPFRQKNHQLIELYKGWVHPGSPWLEAAPVERDLLIHAALFRDQYPGVKMPDAIHLTTALFLTADKGIPRTSRITMPGPKGFSRTSEDLAAIEPTVENLKSISAQLQ